MIDSSLIPKYVVDACQKLNSAGFEAYIVGGSIRDVLRNEIPKDWDITTNATPEQIQACFDHTFYENTYGTVGVVCFHETPEEVVIEVTPYRSEGAYSNSRHPDNVQFGVSLEKDLERRDFTVNAIAYDPIKNNLVDPYGGQDDLKKKIIKTVGHVEDRFSEDALRMLRAIRFSCQLNFSIDGEILSTISKLNEKMKLISTERIRDEFVKILLSPNPMAGIFIMEKTALLQHIIPELSASVGIQQNGIHKFDVFEHLLRSLQCAADKNYPLDVRIAALLHDIGKPPTREFSKEKKDYTFYGHEVVGARIAEKILKRMKFPLDMSELVVKLVRWHMFFSDTEKVTLSAARRLVANIGKENIWKIIDVRICDRIGTGRPKEDPYRLRKYKAMLEQVMRDPVSVGMLKIDGKRIMELLGEPGGPRIGQILNALLGEIIELPDQNTDEYLEKRALELSKIGPAELKNLASKGSSIAQEQEEEYVKEILNKHKVR